MSDLPGWLEPGLLVRLDSNPEWGLGQVQSVIGDRVTVTFEHVGKIVFRGVSAGITPVSEKRLTKG